MASLVVMGPPATGSRFPLTGKREFVIGRSTFCDIVLNKRSISREHARIFEQDGEYYIVDLDSLNGTSVNGCLITEATHLSDGARINLFDVPLVFSLYDESKRPSSGSLPVFSGTSAVESPQGSQSTQQTKLDDLLVIVRRLGSSLNVEIILPKILDILFHALPQINSGEILLVEKDGSLSPRATRHGREVDSTVPATSAPRTHRLTLEVMETCVARIDSAGDHSAASALDSMFASTMYVPIILPTRKPLGIIILETEDFEGRFEEADLNLVSGVAVMAAQAIAYARTHETVIEYDRTRNYLETAREIQLRMLPRDTPKVSGYEFAHYYRAAQTVGGDAFIYYTLPDGRIAVGVADASGKGLPASLKIAEFIAEIRHCVSTAVSLKSAMDYLNKQVCRMDEGFITFCLTILDPKRHTLSVVNAGHPPPQLRRGDGTLLSVGAERASFPLGLVTDAQFHPLTVTISVGDQLVVFTDGFTEAFDKDGKMFGQAGLEKALRPPAESAEARVHGLVAEVEDFRNGCKPSDDQCLVVMARNA